MKATTKNAKAKSQIQKPAAPDMPAPDADVIQLLHRDHQLVRELFFQFSQAEESKEKAELVKSILKELEIHAAVEEEIVYPAIREEAEDAEDMMDEADTEHHVVKLLMAELAKMKPSDDYFDAKVTVLCEMVDHHVKEEEKEMFEKMSESDLDLEALAQEVMARKQELKGSVAKLPVKTAAKSRRKAS